MKNRFYNLRSRGRSAYRSFIRRRLMAELALADSAALDRALATPNGMAASNPETAPENTSSESDTALHTASRQPRIRGGRLMKACGYAAACLVLAPLAPAIGLAWFVWFITPECPESAGASGGETTRPSLTLRRGRAEGAISSSATAV